PHGEWRERVLGGAARRKRNRLHRHFAHAFPHRSVHPAPLHDRDRRTHVPRIRAHSHHRGHHVGSRLSYPDADDVQPAAAAAFGRGAARRHSTYVQSSGRSFGRALSTHTGMGASPRDAHAWRHRRNPRRNSLALHHHSERISAAAGYRSHL